MLAARPLRRLALVAILSSILLWPVLTAAAPAAPRTGLTPNNGCFIRSLYGDLLGRQPNATEITAGLTLIAGHNRQFLASAILASDEYRIDLIQGWYRRFLGRPATGAEVIAGITLFDAGKKDEDVMASILGSNEYFTRAGSTNTKFIQAVYQDVLGRPATSTDISNGLIELGSLMRQQYVSGVILSSPEYRDLIIQGWYLRFLRRPPTGSELSFAEGILGSGGTDEDVIAIILGGDEYFSRAGLCSILYVPIVRR